MTPVKKTAAKRPRSLKSASAVRPVQNSRAKYVLTIMILSAVILFIVSKNQKNTGIRKQEIQKKVETKKTDKKNILTKKDDKIAEKPSGIIENSKKSIEVSVFYLVFQSDETVKYIPVKSSVKTNDKYSEAMKLLVSGPSSQMKSKGYQSAFPAGVKVHSVKVINRIAIIDLGSEIRENAVGDILTARVNQIFYTMKNFTEVDGIEIRIDGKAVNTLGGDGHVFNWPLKEKL
jgi:spore germination protein GerM